MDTNLQPLLSRLDASLPLLAIYGEKDMIVSSEHASFLNNDDGRPHQLIVMPRASHFPFLEETNKFNRLIRDFLESKGTPVEIKEQWRRRVSQHEYL
jgi:pimeloyl-ACP methyl ester carboxylesterase